MKRLAIVATNGPQTVGGLAAYARRLADELRASWHVQHVVRFAERGHAGTSYTEHERARTISGTVPVTVVAPHRGWQAALHAMPRLIGTPALRPLGARLFTAALKGPLDDAIDPRTDLIHVVGAGWEMLGIAADATARSRGIPLTVCPAIHPGIWGDSDLDAGFYKLANAVFVESEVERQRVLELGVRPDRIVRSALAPAVAADGDASRFRAAHDLDGKLIILFVGRKVDGKGHPALLAAVETLRRDVPAAMLVTIGTGPTTRADGVLDLEVADDVATADAFAACDIFCLPSSAEAFGIVYTEAWSYGKPVVGGPAPAVVELIEDGTDGFVVTQDPGEIARALRRLADDQRLREQMGRSGLQRQRREFSWPAVAAVHREVFDRLSTQRDG